MHKLGFLNNGQKMYLGVDIIYNKVFRDPIRVLYLSLPSIHGVGGWGGISKETICSVLTSVPESHWHVEQPECNSIINRRVDATIAVFGALAYITIILRVVLYMFECIDFIIRLPAKKIAVGWNFIPPNK